VTAQHPEGTAAAGRDIDRLVAELSLEEKAALTAGVDTWHTFAVDRLGIPAVKLTDGPNGARGATINHESATPSVCIPSASALGATWDPELVGQAAAVVARQARDKKARVLLAPTVNLHRHPLWGRNFEAFSEDPYLTAKLAVRYIQAVQDAGMVATVKHFVGNEAEYERTTTSSDIDERTLRELYLLPFEYAVRVAGVLSVMTGYNRVNGTHVPDDLRLLTEILRHEWGFDGFVMTDWWGLSKTVEAAVAGLELEMPGPARSFGPALGAAVADGRVAESVLDEKVRRMLSVFDRIGALDDGPDTEETPVDRPEDRALVRRAASEAMVLLANDGVLPLQAASLRRVVVLGPNAASASVTGGGSAKVVTHYRVTPLDALRERLEGQAEVVYEAAVSITAQAGAWYAGEQATAGVSGAGDEDDAGIARAVALAGEADAVIVVVGTDGVWESEGYDRAFLELPGRQQELVERVLEVHPGAIVVLNTGSPVAVPFAPRAGAVLQAWFGGQELGHALTDVLFGDTDPGGRLPTTYPVRIEHTPAFGNFPGESSHTRYGEGPLIGYRWYDARHLPVQYPFGYGLSYTTFEIGAPVLSAARLEAGGRVEIDVPVTNTGARRGAEVVQLYVAPPGGGQLHAGERLHPVKALKAFAKVWLEPGETTSVHFSLGERSFAYYDAEDTEWAEMLTRRPNTVSHGREKVSHKEEAGWYVEPGSYGILIGRSAAELLHRVELDVAGGDKPLDPGTPLD
jgi:beta-glucosidase